MALNDNGDLLLSEPKAIRIWEEYTSPESRLILLNRYNDIVGPPSESVVRVQEDFIKARMAPEELVDFIISCKAIISAANRELE
jgi:hypothetical protein